MWRLSLWSMAVAVLFLVGVTQATHDITMPGDPIQGVPNDGVSTDMSTNGWPGNEAPDQAVDNQIVTKFLHFRGEVQPTGIRVAPKYATQVVTGINLCTANDAVERDPVKYELSGSNVSIDGPYTVISSGDIKDFAGGTWLRRTWLSKPITFTNTVAYKYYQLLFPLVFNPSAANSMQIAEIELLTADLVAYNPTPTNGAMGVTSGLLQWTPGDVVAFEDIYVGTTPNLTAADLAKKHQSGTAKMYYYTKPLEPGQTYYWRVDDIDKKGVVTTGNVWSFMVAPLTAYSPTPLDGDKWQDPEVDLSWLPGQGAEQHNLYFGTDQAKVAARDASVSEGTMAAMTFDPGTLAAQTTYYWAVDETVEGETVAGPVWSFTTIGPNPGGAKGEYFNNTTLSGLPVMTRIDPTIDVTADPGSPVVAGGWSARWTADLEIIRPDTYTFAINCYAGTRMWIDDQLIIDKWVSPTVTSKYFSLPVYLAKGVHSLQIEYFSGGTVAEQLYWSTATMAETTVPGGPLQPPVHSKPVNPQNGDVNVPQDVTLTWSIGEKAATHDVYFGDDKDAVAAATPADAAIYKGSQARDENTFAPGALEWNKTYYWRIDEVNTASADSPWKSAVWSFTTANFLVIDNFESYTDDVGSRIFQTWIDGWGFTEPAPGNPGNGTGATVGYTDPPFAEHTIVHSGGSSMPLAYNNADSPYYSEAERTFDSPQNWTVNGVNTLSLAVRGYPEVNNVSVTETGGKMTLTGDGTDIWNASDDFTYAYKSLNGDATIVARVVSNGTGTNTWTKGGVMIRDSLDGNSMFANMVITAGGGNGGAFQNRATTGLNMGANDATSNTNSTGVIAPPYWVKVERVGDTFTGYTSSDGSTWVAVGTTTITMTGPVCIGICVTSGAAGAPRTFQFDNIKTTGSVTGAWQGAVINSPQYNPAQNLYVALQDSAGKVAVATDATAVNSASWVEVKMPLSSFTGVSMTKVKKIVIGVGDRNSPAADGTGKLFIDDIRVIKQ